MPKRRSLRRAKPNEMTPLQAHAFELYFGMEKDVRSVAKVGQLLGRSERQIRKWSDKFRWGKLIIARQEEIGKRLRQKTDDDIVAKMQMLSQVWMGLAARLVVIGPDGKSILAIKPKDVADAERITKMLLLLSGQATERIEIAHAVIVRVMNAIDETVTDEFIRGLMLQPDRNPANEIRFRLYQRIGGVVPAGGGQAANASRAGESPSKPAGKNDAPSGQAEGTG